MMNQYKEETLQIHAPAELIQKTKRAVQEEERRIQQMGNQHVLGADNVWQNTPGNTVDRHPRFRYGKIYHWALPVAGAAVLLILVHTTTTLLKNGGDKASMFTAQDTNAGGAESADMEMQFAGNVMEDMAAEAAEEPIGADMSDADESAMVPTENAAASIKDEYKNMDAENDSYADEAVEEENDAGEGAADGWDASMSVTEVDEQPAFYDDPDTERVILHDIAFYVTSDWYGSWAAYAEVGGEQYVIVGGIAGEIADCEDYAGKAYELLREITDGLE